MKLLSEIIANNKLKEEFIDHYIINNDLIYNLYEHGIGKCYYEGQLELARYTAKQCYEMKNDFKINGSSLSYKNIFFDIIEIKYIDNGLFAYKPSEAVYNKVTHKMSKIVFQVNKNEIDNYKQTAITITHELLHAYRDWKSYVNGTDHLKDICKAGGTYNTLAKSFLDITESGLKNIYKGILYYINELEITAFSSEFAMICADNINNVKDYSEMIDIFMNSETYKLYKSALDTVYFMQDYPDIKKEFTEYYNSLYNTNYSIDKFFKFLISKYKDILNDMQTQFPRLYHEAINKNITECIMGRPKNLDEPFKIFKDLIID